MSFYTLKQDTSDEQKFAFIECWKDEAAIETHGKTEHYTSILPKLSELCESTAPMELYREVE